MYQHPNELRNTCCAACGFYSRCVNHRSRVVRAEFSVARTSFSSHSKERRKLPLYPAFLGEREVQAKHPEAIMYKKRRAQIQPPVNYHMASSTDELSRDKKNTPPPCWLGPPGSVSVEVNQSDGYLHIRTLTINQVNQHSPCHRYRPAWSPSEAALR